MTLSETPPHSRYLTAEVPGTGGRYRDAPEDFEVEEIWPAPPAGSGEHVYVWIEKRGIPTLAAARRLVRALGALERDMGYAGLKDTQAVARQMFSFRFAGDPEEKLSAAGEILGPEIRVLSLNRGLSKIRRGDHAGNRFRIRLRGAGPGAEAGARATLAVLEKRGLPNAFGEQRFGARGHSAKAGRALATGEMAQFVAILLEGGFSGGPDRETEYRRRLGQGDHAGARSLLPESREIERRLLSRLAKGQPPGQAAGAVPRKERGLYASAYQAALFNRCLAVRLEEDAHDRLMAGDVVVSHRTGKIRRIGEPEKEAAALARFDVSPAGPMFGEKMLPALGRPGGLERACLERECLASQGLSPEALFGGLSALGAHGGRRAYRARLENIALVSEDSDLVLAFSLPPGAYASEVMREVVKTVPPAGHPSHPGENDSEIKGSHIGGGEE